MRCTPLEVECIGKGKARAPYEFGCKVSVVTPATKPTGGQFVLHAKALHGNPFEGHTLGPVIAELESLTGVETRRIHVDKGYRGHNHAHKFRVWITGQVRRVTRPIRREMKRRAAVEPVIGHLKAEHRLGRNYLKGRDGDRQRHPRRRRLQLRPPPALAEEAFARPPSGALPTADRAPIRLKTAAQPFFTDDSVTNSTRTPPAENSSTGLVTHVAVRVTAEVMRYWFSNANKTRHRHLVPAQRSGRPRRKSVFAITTRTHHNGALLCATKTRGSRNMANFAFDGTSAADIIKVLENGRDVLLTDDIGSLLADVGGVDNLLINGNSGDDVPSPPAYQRSALT
jgi:hypothetical protein